MKIGDGMAEQSSTAFTIADFLSTSKRRQESPSQHSHFRQYKENKKELINLGIGKMLEDTSENEELQRYIDERHYETASLGETSADELALRENSSAGDLSDGASEIDIYRTDEISAGYQKAQKLSNAIKDYEVELV